MGSEGGDDMVLNGIALARELVDRRIENLLLRAELARYKNHPIEAQEMGAERELSQLSKVLRRIESD